MATIVDYPHVLQTLTAKGFRCLHYNGGVFGFDSDETVTHVGWLIGDDPTLTAAARQMAHLLCRPSVTALASGLIEMWQCQLAGPLWIMPGSHWAYELTYGGKAELAELLQSLGIEPDRLSYRTEAAAIEFTRPESAAASAFCDKLLQSLAVTDFTAVFPESRVLALLHHHQQVWWSLPASVEPSAFAKFGTGDSKST